MEADYELLFLAFTLVGLALWSLERIANGNYTCDCLWCECGEEHDESE